MESDALDPNRFQDLVVDMAGGLGVIQTTLLWSGFPLYCPGPGVALAILEGKRYHRKYGGWETEVAGGENIFCPQG